MLHGQVAVITGAGSGFGRATAQRFAQEGARVLVADVNPAAADATVDLIRTARGEAAAQRVDVSRGPQVQAMIQAALDRWGRLDVLFNNAGVPQTPTPTEEITEEFWDRLMAVNVKGVFLGCKYAAPVMKRQGRGCIINMASTMGIRARPQYAAYVASKGAVILLTKSVALELAAHTVRVNVIAPAGADTPMLTQFFGGKTREEARAAFLPSIPMGRLIEADDVAKAALYLASDLAEMVTGHVLEVDGGRAI
jgi:3-oxoacyl-[acyl-carrier protein] reductase